MSYWKQKASPVVSFTVLAGGALIAGLLFFLVQLEESAQGVFGQNYNDIEYLSEL